MGHAFSVIRFGSADGRSGGQPGASVPDMTLTVAPLMGLSATPLHPPGTVNVAGTVVRPAPTLVIVRLPTVPEERLAVGRPILAAAAFQAAKPAKSRLRAELPALQFLAEPAGLTSGFCLPTSLFTASAAA